MRRLRFCMLTTFYPPFGFGGDAIQTKRLANALAARGHDVTVVHSREAFRALRRAEPDPDAPETDVPDGPVKVVSIDAGVGALSPLTTHVTGHPVMSRRALAELLDQDFDVLHLHNPSLLGGPALLGMGTGLKLYTAHEQWLLCPTHVLWKHKREVCEKPTCWRCGLTYRRPPQLWRSTGLLERSVAELDALIAPSAASARLHERFDSLVRIERLPHFVPDVPSSQTDVTPPEPGRRPYFLFAGRLESIKGAARLIEAFRDRPTEDLVIAGSGALERSLREAASDLPHVRFVGWQGEKELDRLYRGALAVIVPSLGHESFGLVAVEAFARGTPVIVPAFGALGELIDDSGAGLAYGSQTELVAAIARLASDAELRAELGRRGRRAYLECWTTDAHLARYFALIADLADERGDRGLALAATAASKESDGHPRPPAPNRPRRGRGRETAAGATAPEAAGREA